MPYHGNTAVKMHFNVNRSSSKEEYIMSKSSAMKRNLNLAQMGVMSALIIAMTFVPYLGYISYGGLSITLIHIPVIIGACVMGVKGGAVLGTVWGASCIIKALLAPPSPLEGIIFKNPVVALIPRIIAGAAAGLIFTLVAKKDKKKHIASALGALGGCLCNTVLVMGSIYLLYGEKYGAELGIASVNFGGLTNYILAAFGVNAIIEIVVAIVIAIPVSLALRKVKTKI